MRILFLTQVLPYPLDAGPKVRAYYVLRHLAQSHQVTLVSFVRSGDTLAAVEHLKRFCQAVHTVPMLRSRWRDAVYLVRSLVTGQPFIIARDRVPAMNALLDSLLQAVIPADSVNRAGIHMASYDVVHADQLWMAPHALGVRCRPQSSPRRRRVGSAARSDHPLPAVPLPAVGTGGMLRDPRLVLDEHNAVHLIPARLAEGEPNPLKRALLQLEAHKLARYEVEACRQFDRVVWVTSQDHEAVQRQTAGGRSRVPTSGVIPICGDPQAMPVVVRKPDARRVTFLGGLHYLPNAQGVIWFVEQVFPRILAEVPDAVLTVIGKDPPAELAASPGRSRSPASRGRSWQMANCEVTGYVDELRPYLEETAAFVVPLLAGGGMRVKIVDAWLWGLPIVSTTIGAEGIKVLPGENILIADAPEAFAQATAHLLLHPAEGERLAQAGRRWAEQYYDWRTVYRQWDEVYSGLEAVP